MTAGTTSFHGPEGVPSGAERASDTCVACTSTPVMVSWVTPLAFGPAGSFMRRADDATRPPTRWDPMPTGDAVSTNRPPPRGSVRARSLRPIRVVAVESSPVVRGVIRHELNANADIKLVAVAIDAAGARGAIYTHRPDVVLTDLRPEDHQDLDLLRELRRLHPVPVVLFTQIDAHSAAPIAAALRDGALEVVAKPQQVRDYDELELLLPEAIRAAFAARPDTAGDTAERPRGPCSGILSRHAAERAVVVVGGATGSLPALRTLLASLPPICPPIAVAIHHPAGITAALAADLDAISSLRVRVAEDGRSLRPCEVLLAPGGSHLELDGAPGDLRVTTAAGELCHGHRPGVDLLMRSAARTAATAATGLILSGRGSDGATGMRALRQAGGETIAQDEATSLLYGMPAAAIKLGAVDHVLPERELARGVMRCAIRRAGHG